MNNIVFNRQDDTVTGLNRPVFGPGEYAVQLPFDIQLSKGIKSVNGEKQKINEYGQLLYTDGEIETTETRIVTAWHESTETYTTTDAAGERVTIQVPVRLPTAWVDLQPVMVPNESSTMVTFQEAPTLFTYDEIVAAKISSIKANSGRELVFFDENFPLENYSCELLSHAANMGDGVMAIHPQGCCRTVKLPLGRETNIVQVYLEAQPDVKIEIGPTANQYIEVINGIAELPEVASEVYVRFTNMADRYREVYAFGILI